MTDRQAPQPASPPAPPTQEPAGAKPKRPRIVLIVVMVLATLFAFGAVSTLVRSLFDGPVAGQAASYTSEEHGYTIEFPGEPKETTQAVPVNGQSIDLDSAVWEDSDSALLASAAVFPDGFITDVDGALQGAVEGAVGNLPGGAITESEPIELAGMQAMRAEATSTNGDAYLIVAFDADGNVQFQLLSLNVDEATAQEFFDSFTLTG